MLYRTKGIVIKQTKFSDSGAIVKIFTEELGVQSFFVRGLQSRKSKNKAALFQPLTMLELVVSYSEKKSLHSIKEVSIWYPYRSATQDMIKRTILFFINELLHKSLKEETENKELFNWIHSALVWFDLTDKDFVNFHLVFMMQLSMFLGFYPKNDTGYNSIIFNMQEGRFCSNIPLHSNYIKGDTTTFLKQILETKFEDSGNIEMSNKDRKMALDALIDFYKIHMPSFRDFNSLDVLSVVLND